MARVKAKASFIRRQIWAMLFSATATSCGAYYWKEIANLGSFLVDKALNRPTAAKVEPERVKTFFTSFKQAE